MKSMEGRSDFLRLLREQIVNVEIKSGSMEGGSDLSEGSCEGEVSKCLYEGINLYTQFE